METLKTLLPKLKANRYTFYNLSKRDIESYKDLYQYLKKHQEKNVGLLHFKRAITILESLESLDFLKKYKAMKEISYGITH